MSLKTKDIAAMGTAIYNDNILPTLGPEHKGKLVVIDVKTGNYEIGGDDVVLTMRLRERNPDASTWAERVGYPAAYEFGFRVSPAVHD